MARFDAASFNRALRRQPNIIACGELFREAIAPFGFDTFACGEVDFRHRIRGAFHIIGWPPEWTKFYMNSALVERDPLIEELQRRDEPFTWSDLRADRKLAQIGREALRLVAEAGWTEGLVVPLRQSSDRVGLVSLVGHRDCTDPEERAFLELICVCLHGHVRTLVSREGFAVPPAGLTDRELECVRLATHGLTDTAIATKLGIAQSTAHEFVEKAKKRLGVRGRAELAAVAAALGIADI